MINPLELLGLPSPASIFSMSSTATAAVPHDEITARAVASRYAFKIKAKTVIHKPSPTKTFKSSVKRQESARSHSARATSTKSQNQATTRQARAAKQRDEEPTKSSATKTTPNELRGWSRRIVETSRLSTSSLLPRHLGGANQFWSVRAQGSSRAPSPSTTAKKATILPQV